MKKSGALLFAASTKWFISFGWIILLLAAYGRLILHPGLHTACPENDTWNLPIRWSVLSALREGRIPLWNSSSAFGIPWLATWQTECFYPGTLLFTGLGLFAWNYSGLLHLLILSLGVFFFLRSHGVGAFWAFCSAAIALLNGCAYNHLGSNSSMDTMAWIPWIFWATDQCLGRKPWGSLKWTLFFTLQVFAGYPQIILYTLVTCFLYSATLKGLKASVRLLPAFFLGLLFSAAQWLPSIEYFFLDSVRLPAVRDNPHFFLPLENLKTFLDFNALSTPNRPDYVVNPTFFYFDFYSGLLPLAALLLGFVRFKKLQSSGRFFLIGLLLLILWSLGFFLAGLDFIHLPYPAFLEPAKCWVLINVFELFTLGLILRDLFPSPGRWKWPVLALALLNLLWPIWTHPLEQNLAPSELQSAANEIRSYDQKQGHILILPDANEHTRLYTPLPDPKGKPLFKHFIPNSNLFNNLSSATFYGSTQPTWGALDAGFYFQYGFPYPKGCLLDMLGVDLIYLPEAVMPSRFKKSATSDDSWTLWQNPGSVGSNYFFSGIPQKASRKEAFTAFASGTADPRKDLFLDSEPVSAAPRHRKFLWGAFKDGFIDFRSMKDSDRYLVVTQNAMPGWRAWVNEKPSSVYTANGIFLCVPIPLEPGITHEVTLTYEPASFRLGLFLSLMTLAGLLGGLGFKKRGWIRR